MLIESFETIKTTFLEYKGTGAYIVLYLIALLYIYFKEENKNIKAFMVYFSLLMSFITLNPIFSKLVEPFFPVSVYWRMYWMLPMGLTIAYAFTKLIASKEKKLDKAIIFIVAITVIILSGKFIYTEENYIEVNNLYKVPDEALEVANIIMQDNTETKKVMPCTSLIAYLRQVYPEIELMYAREPKSYENVTIVVQQEKGNIQYVTNVCKKENCNYIIFHKAMAMNGNMEDYGYDLFAETANYRIYKNSDIK